MYDDLFGQAACHIQPQFGRGLLLKTVGTRRISATRFAVIGSMELR